MTNPLCVVGIDPGPREHAAVMLCGDRVEVVDVAKPSGLTRLLIDRRVSSVVVAYEQFAPFGSSLDDGSLRTIFETGRLVEDMGEAMACLPAVQFVGIRRQQAKRFLVGRTSCGDTEVRGALIERFGPTKELAIGTKKKPGPLYGITSHHWAALAIAVTAADQVQREEAKRLSWV
jgi:hypothetical protein